MKKIKQNNGRLPLAFYNYTTYIGTFITIISSLAFAFLFIISFLFAEGLRYQSLFIWIIVPIFIVFGLVLIAVGMIFKRKKNKRLNITTAQENRFVFDLNKPRTRNAFLIFSIGTVILFLMSSVGSYKAFQYSSSVEFCGTLCHEVMKPEYVTYQNFSHAKVSCVECHVGAGANFWAKSKLSGLYQVYATVVNDFPRPIPTPITSLRPAQEACEECHWPEKFYSHKLVTKMHYLTDSLSTPWEMSLQMKTSSANCALGQTEGIHWHINPEIKIEYIHLDANKKMIPWVRYTNLETGKIKVFECDTLPKLSESQINSSEIREMDCIDCHNRPSHDYQTPITFINEAITAGRISRDLPDIKLVSLDITSHEFSTTDSSLAFIDSFINDYYSKQYPDIYNNKPELITQAIKGLQDGFEKNIFPEMGVSWAVYPNHIGHIEFDGCFRCHNDKHKTSDGEVISMDCDLCHTIIAQGVPDTIQRGPLSCDGLEFIHIHDPENFWQGDVCSGCHNELWGRKKKEAIIDEKISKKINLLDTLSHK